MKNALNFQTTLWNSRAILDSQHCQKSTTFSDDQHFWKPVEWSDSHHFWKYVEFSAFQNYQESMGRSADRRHRDRGLAARSGARGAHVFPKTSGKRKTLQTYKYFETWATLRTFPWGSAPAYLYLYLSFLLGSTP